MARTLIPVVEVTRPVPPAVPAADVAGAASDVVNGNYVPNDGMVIVEVANVSVDTARALIVVLPGKVDGAEIVDKTYTIPFGGATAPYRKLGTFPRDVYGSEVWLNGAHADLKIRAVRVRPS